jgi:hypothetical protein
MSSVSPALPPYAAMPPAQVRSKLGAHRVRALAITAVVAVAGIVSAAAVIARPSPPQPCGYYCGPQSEAPLPAPATYTNQAHGFSIDYLPSQLKVASQDSDVVEFHSDAGPIAFKVVSAASLDAAVSSALADLSTAVFQERQEVGPVRGAEIGYVPGKGTVWAATYAPSGGGGRSPVRIAIIAAQSKGMTVVATMFSDYDSATAHAPYGLSGDSIFDYPVSNFHFPGGQ